MKLVKNRKARVFKEISDKPIYILDFVSIPTNGNTLVYYSEENSYVNDVKTKSISLRSKKWKT